MKSQVLKLGVQQGNYDLLRTVGTGVVLSMTSNPNFPAPSPSLAAVQSATDQLSSAITAWGTRGHRGSHSDFANLLTAEFNLRKLLKLEMLYVMSLVNPDASPLDQRAFLLSSGFGVRKDPEPQGVLQAPVNFRQMVHARYSQHTPKLKWSRPQGMNNRLNVKTYFIYRSLVNDFSKAVQAGTSTTTSFIDMHAPKGDTFYYFVAASNTAGIGVATDGITVMIPK